MAVTWSTRRQILYYIVAIVIVGVLGFFIWYNFIRHAPICTDAIQNGTETGIDCGGICAALCPDVARPPVVLWQRSFETSPHNYTAVAYVQNNNVASGAGARRVHYAFKLYDDQNDFVKEIDGTTDLPPTQTIPIVAPNIDVGTRTVGRTYFEFANEPIYWKRIPTASIQNVRIADTSAYENGRLLATVANDTFDDIKHVQLVAVLFDSAGVARAASQSVITKIAHKSMEKVIFTWPNEFPDIVRAEVTVIPAF